MADSIESMRRSSVEVIDLKTSDIEPDPANPNVVSQELMDALRNDIVERGFVQPVLVRPYEGHYRVIDGEHRCRVLLHARAKTAPSILRNRRQDDARLRLVSMNRLRGEFAPVKLAKVLSNLAKTMSEEELRERLGMDHTEYEATMSVELAGADVDERLNAALLHEAMTAPVVLAWRFDLPDADAVDAAIQSQLDGGAETKADALIQILEADL